MHGHALRLLAEEEHIDQWADFTPGAIYGAIKRLAADELIASLRVEREGNYLECQVYDITDAGHESLTEIRRDALETIVLRPDPVDLALARLDDESLDALEQTLEFRAAELRGLIDAEERKAIQIFQYLTLMERLVTGHDIYRLRGELAWHEALLGQIPEIQADEKQRKGRLT